MSRRGLTVGQAAALGIVVPKAPKPERPTPKQLSLMTPPPPIVLKIRGDPIPQPRQDGRVVWVHGKPTVMMYTPQVRRTIGRGHDGKKIQGPDLLEQWRGRVKAAAIPHIRETWFGPVVVHCQFYFSRPEKLLGPKAPTGAIPYMGRGGDRDNLDKAVLDALSEIEPTPPWGNDLQVYGGQVWKWYVALGANPGARIDIEFQSTSLSEEQLLLQDAATEDTDE